jgi:hypothetical protein
MSTANHPSVPNLGDCLILLLESNLYRSSTIKILCLKVRYKLITDNNIV